MVEVIGSALSNLPWEDRPAGCHDVVWRSARNPVIPRDLIPCANSIFNSAVVPFEGAFAGVFRVDHRTRAMRIHAGRSQDGVSWQIDERPIEWVGDTPELQRMEYAYDPRVCWLEESALDAAGRCTRPPPTSIERWPFGRTTWPS